jgi:hypothetical protein
MQVFLVTIGKQDDVEYSYYCLCLVELATRVGNPENSLVSFRKLTDAIKQPLSDQI